MNFEYEIKKIIATQMQIPSESLSAATRLEDIGVDSIDVLEIVFNIEQKFGIEIPLNAYDDIAKTFETIGSVAVAVETAFLATT